MKVKHTDNKGYVTYKDEYGNITTEQQELFKTGDKVYNRHRKTIGRVITVENGCNGLINCDFGYGFVLGYNPNDLGVLVNDREYIFKDKIYTITA